MNKRSSMGLIHVIETWRIDHNKQFLYSIDSFGLHELPVFLLGIPTLIIQKPSD